MCLEHLFFFPVGSLVQYLQRLPSRGGAPVGVKQPNPSFRLVHVPKPVLSHRPQHLSWLLVRRRKSLPRFASAQCVRDREEPASSVVPCLESGAPHPASLFSMGGGFFFPASLRSEGGWWRKWLKGTVTLRGEGAGQAQPGGE